jgi:peptidoglycan/LPS O-acetylase OafA/YrhL
MSDEHAEVSLREARARLDEASRARDTVRARDQRWWLAYLGSAGVAILILFPLIGLLPSGTGASIFTTAWSAGVGILVSYSGRRRVVRRAGHAWRVVAIWGSWAVVYAAALTLGELFFRGRPAYWLPMDVVVAAPLLIGAWWSSRR